MNSILAMSLNLVNGITGQFSLGHTGFMAVGAYFSSYAAIHFQLFQGSLEFLNYIYTFLGAGALAAFAGYLVGQPSLRLRGDYLAIVTLGFGEIIGVALLNMDFLGGPRGIAGIPSISNNYFGTYIYSIFWAIVCYFTLRRLMNSAHGLAFLSIREDEIAAEAMGIPTAKTKVRAFVLSSFFAGIAGALYAHVVSFISPSSFGFMQSVNCVIMVVLGGMGSLKGSIAAAIIMTILPELLRPVQEYTGGVDLRMVIFSLCLILLMLMRPQGLFGGFQKKVTQNG